MSPEDVLRLLDQAAEQQHFLQLGHPYSYPIRARLHVHGDAVTWALLMECAGFVPRAADIVDTVHVIRSDRPAETHRLPRLDNPTAVLDSRMQYTGSPILVRGRSLYTAADAGGAFEDIARALPPGSLELLLLDDGERDQLVRDLPPLLLRLDDWHHVDATARPVTAERQRAAARRQALIRPGDEVPPFEIRPSGLDTYRQIAAVLAAGSAGHYRPTQSPTSHWSFWPMAGTM